MIYIATLSGKGILALHQDILPQFLLLLSLVRQGTTGFYQPKDAFFLSFFFELCPESQMTDSDYSFF
jgi:hypothetical protein